MADHQSSETLGARLQRYDSAMRSPTARRVLAIAAIALLGVSDFSTPKSLAQPVPVGGPGGAPGQRLTPEDIARMRAAQGAVKPEGQPVPQPAGAQPNPGEVKPPEGEKKEEAKTLKRPTDKPKADAAELKVAPDKDGMVQFNFRGQPWTDVLEWFAGVAGYSLDWQELPADFLNLSTQRRHTIAETRDLLNRHLLARGFTMILQGESLTVVKTDKIDPSLVPRVEADLLDDQSPYDFVRTRFPIPDSMDPAKAVEDVKLLLSPAAKVTPLLASKQLQVIDAVANLRDVRDLLYGEQLVASQDVRPKPFMIRHRRADYIADQVMIVLGLDPSARKDPMELQIEQQRMQLAMQMQQQGKDISTMLKKDGPQVYIAVDKRRNAILVNAPPKEMAIVQRTIEQFDVPEGATAAELGDSRALTLEKYPTKSTDAVVKALEDIGTLDPLTQLQGDSRSDTIFAYATPADHATIKRMIDKLDGGGRGGFVIPLNRRMPADQAAGTIQALMVGEKKEEDNNSRRGFYYGYNPWGDNDEKQDESDFRIQADIENNRLLLWANDAEYKEVYSLLETLGAVSSGGRNLDKMRILDAGTAEETAKLLERLQQMWAGKNPLEIKAPAPAVKEPAVKEEPAATGAKPEEPENADKLTRDDGLPAITGRPRASFAQFSAPAEQSAPADEQAPATVAVQPPAADAGEQKKGVAAPASPIRVTVTDDGRIILSSDDSEALDQLEELMADLSPPQKEFEAFYLRTADALDVYYNLKDYFEEELKGQTEGQYSMWGEYMGSRKLNSGPTSLGRRRLLRFIYDLPTNTIVVQNASEAQLEIIRELIKIYDQPIGEDSVARRRTEVIPIRYSNAQQIGTALKEVYRDLLSSKDKEFQNREGQQRTRTETYYRFSGGSDKEDKKSSPVKVAFEGALSIGVDEISNTLIISAEENVYEEVRNLAVALDEKAKPDTVVQIYQLRGSLDAKGLQTALQGVMGQPWPGGKPPQAQNNRGEGDRGNDRRNRSRDRGDRGNRNGN